MITLRTSKHMLWQSKLQTAVASRGLRTNANAEFAATKISQCTLGRSKAQLDPPQTIGYVHLGRVAYGKALDLQKALVRKRIDEIYSGPRKTRSDKGRKLADSVILLEHDPVYTNGRRNHGKVTQDEIRAMEESGAEYYETNRGGEVTFHGPGQLVVYPSFYLKDHSLGTKCYVEGLENTIIETCAQFGIPADRLAGFPGVWTSPTEKVAALGTHVQKYVTSHGFALNCNTDLSWFSKIVPCGLEGKTATSIEQVLRDSGRPAGNTGVDDVLPVALSSFAKVFGCNVRPLQEVSPFTYQTIMDLLR